MTNELILYDRSRVVTDWKCPRQRYWNYEHDGMGITPNTTSIELFLGTTVHDAIAMIATMTREGLEVDIDEIATTAHSQMFESLRGQGTHEEIEFALEQSALVEGMIRGFHRSVWSRIISVYPEILFIEQEMRYDHDRLVMMCKPDLVMKNATETVYFEWKTTGWKKQEWMNQWDTAVQLHSTLRAIEQTTGVHVDAVVIQGLYKGFESYGKQSSPFCYAYRKPANPPFTKEVLSYEYLAGLKRSPTWELPGGVAAWVNEMPDETLSAQFPATPPIYVNDALVERFFTQRATREYEIAVYRATLAERPDRRTEILDARFPQRFDQCTPGFGRPCSYRLLCHGGVSDPLTSGFTYRTPHHQPELDQWEAAATPDPTPDPEVNCLNVD